MNNFDTNKRGRPGESNAFVKCAARAPRFRTLRAAVDEAIAAAERLAVIERGRKIERPDARSMEALQQKARVHMSGLRGSSIVLVAEALREKLDTKVVVVCRDEEAAADMHSDFRTFSGGRVVHFPERDIFPHRFERENLAVRGDRNDVLLKVSKGNADVVVTSLLGYLEKTIPVASLRANQFQIHAGESLDMEALREHLVSTGYDAVPVVEEAGQFAVRGAIVDLFDPSWSYPARVELFDDEVESIRTFDLDTQRSIENVTSLSVLPAASVPIEDGATARLGEFLSERGFSKDQIARITEEITHNRHSFLWRRYAPALGMNGSLLDFFATPPVVIFADAGALNQSFARMQSEVDRVSERPEEDFQVLPMTDYVHRADLAAERGMATVFHWSLAAEASAGARVKTAAPAPGENPDDTSNQPDGPFLRPGPGERVLAFKTGSHPSVVGNLENLVSQVRRMGGKGVETYIFAETPTQRERLADMLDENETLVHLPVGWVTSGFTWEEAGLAVFTDHQIFNRMLPRPKRKRSPRRVQGMRHEHLQVGDVVVHVDYGIGRFVGLDKLGKGHQEAECLVLRYEGGDKIYVPLDQMHLVEKYVGKEGVVPRLDNLGGSRWARTKERARKAIEDIARDLLHVYAKREITPGHAFGPDTQWQRELEASFPYEETPHQLSATSDIKEDMERAQPMDRLVCGDVGYGKTEVAIRAAFKAAAAGKQVAILVPTTLLAFQHFTTFKERMNRFPLRLEMLSRFVSASDQKVVVEGLKKGVVDVVVGTHRLLSKDIEFKDLGLLIIDEEHRFGVKHKERLKQLSKSVDVLSLTATPIPRTLYMSLSGLRKISIIDTPPRNRHPVKTEVTGFDEELIARAISEEVSRDGQVFFVHNRVKSIHSMQAFLERLLPGVRFCVAHGQMSEQQLEKVMLDFVERKYDVLVSTMIIESGLDLPNVNTIIINRADRFGLAQLYQLRGRVGRRERQAYAYFLIPRQLSLTETASRRLQAMEEFEELGSGYRLAMRDLEIRGAGNVLGVEQHGHVTAIGFELYCKMLKEAVEQLQSGEEVAVTTQCRVESPFEAFIPAFYIDDADERMMVYKRLAQLDSPDTVDDIAEELRDRFGAPPQAVTHLLDLARIKMLAARLGVVLVQIRQPGYRPPVPQALDRAADVPRSSAKAPRNVPRARHGSNRLRRLAETIGTDGLGAPGADKSGRVILEFGPSKALTPGQCGRLVETFGRRVLFKSGKTFGVTLEADPSRPLLEDAKNLLQVAYFSNRIGV